METTDEFLGRKGVIKNNGETNASSWTWQELCEYGLWLQDLERKCFHVSTAESTRLDPWRCQKDVFMLCFRRKLDYIREKRPALNLSTG